MKLQMTVCPHVRHRPHAQRKFGLEFVTLAKSNDRFCEIMQRRRGRLTNLVGVRSEELLRVHRADLSRSVAIRASCGEGLDPAKRTRTGRNYKPGYGTDCMVAKASRQVELCRSLLKNLRSRSKNRAAATKSIPLGGLAHLRHRHWSLSQIGSMAMRILSKRPEPGEAFADDGFSWFVAENVANRSLKLAKVVERQIVKTPRAND